jgi:hypothetical protein
VIFSCGEKGRVLKMHHGMVGDSLGCFDQQGCGSGLGFSPRHSAYALCRCSSNVMCVRMGQYMGAAAVDNRKPAAHHPAQLVGGGAQ